MFVNGANEKEQQPEFHIVTNASGTTSCFDPFAKVTIWVYSNFDAENNPTRR